MTSDEAGASGHEDALRGVAFRHCCLSDRAVNMGMEGRLIGTGGEGNSVLLAPRGIRLS